MGRRPDVERRHPVHSCHARWVRHLAESSVDVAGPVLAIARSLKGPVTIFDGLHRMAASVAHLEAGRDYPVNVTVALTPEIAPQFEMPP